jgi:hypothetical protein
VPAAAAAAPAAAAPPPQPHVPVAIKGRNIEEIINEWSGELEKQTQAFVKHAGEAVVRPQVVAACVPLFPPFFRFAPLGSLFRAARVHACGRLECPQARIGSRAVARGLVKKLAAAS